MIINNKCYSCNKQFSSSYKSIGIFTKCGHLTHLSKPCNSQYCTICQEAGPVYSDNDYSPQDHFNVLSVTRNQVNLTLKDILRGILRIIKSIPYSVALVFRLCFNYIDKDYLYWLNNYLLDLFDIKVICFDESRKKLLDSSYKRIIIANHTHFHDALIIGSLLTPTNYFGIVASQIISTNLVGKALLDVIPHIIVKGTNNYNKIKSYFEIYPNESRLMIFPEGILTHTRTLCKFRSTAFKLNYPVQPIIIVYEQNVFNFINFNMWCLKNINVIVKVLDPIYTDGSQESIENIRQIMADEGNFLLSNVSNK